MIRAALLLNPLARYVAPNCWKKWCMRASVHNLARGT